MLVNISTLRVNVIANYLGTFWTSVIGLVFLPLYLRIMGAEAYAVVGIASALFALFAALEMGVSATIQREVAVLKMQEDDRLEIPKVVALLETVAWVLAIVVAGLIISLAPLIARYWVKPEHLSVSVLEQTLMVTGLWIGLRWPALFYGGGLLGLQRQALLNIINSIVASIRGLGTLLVLWTISPTIFAFMIVQVVTSACEVVIVRHFMRRELPASRMSSRLDWTQLRTMLQFSIGVTGINVTWILLSAMDSIVLSATLAMQEFGYYSLVRSIALAFERLANPVQQAVYPELTSLTAECMIFRVKELYHRACQLTSVLVVPPALVVIFFSDTVLQLWTRDAVLADKTALVLSTLTVGSYFYCLRLMPLSLQLANGWTGLALVLNIAALLVFTPLLWMLTASHGMLAGAMFWILANLMIAIVGTAVMHTRLLRNEYRYWLLRDVLLPAVAGLCVVGVIKLVASPHVSVPGDLLLLLGVGSGALGATVLASTWPRDMVIGYWRTLLARLGLVMEH